VSSKDVAIIECDVVNPPDNPYRCPPALSQVAVYRDDKIHRVHWYLAPRPVRKGCWERTLPLSAGD
jgi:RNA polymerase sigma-70 factor (ECF subfamily)